MAATELLADLTPLNPAEREVLALLAQGHTAKSIATLTGRTEGSVNERLREARRKTGVASSRELARLLAQAEARKNRDEQIGVVGLPSDGHPRPPAARVPRRLWGKGAVAMGIAGIVASGALLFALQEGPSGAPLASDALLGGTYFGMPSMQELHTQLRSEQRDAAWAPGMEQVIRKHFVKHAGLGAAGDMVRVTCGATLCEVVATIPPGNDRRATAITDRIQKPDLNAAMEAAGVASLTMSFGSTNDKPSKPLYVSYWRRK